MKCPYRVSTKYLKPEQGVILTNSGKIKITLIEQTDYEECYGDECPFYCDNGTRREPICNRVLAEGGDNL